MLNYSGTGYEEPEGKNHIARAEDVSMDYLVVDHCCRMHHSRRISGLDVPSA